MQPQALEVQLGDISIAPKRCVIYYVDVDDENETVSFIAIFVSHYILFD